MQQGGVIRSSARSERVIVWIAFIALISLANIIIGACGGLFGVEALSLQQILGYLFAPIAFLIGIPWSEATQVGSLLGQKLVINEFVAYIDFVGMGDALSAQSKKIVTVALCGFANFSSIAILLAVWVYSHPHVVRYRAPGPEYPAGTLSNFMSAALVGIFFAITTL